MAGRDIHHANRVVEVLSNAPLAQAVEGLDAFQSFADDEVFRSLQAENPLWLLAVIAAISAAMSFGGESTWEWLTVIIGVPTALLSPVIAICLRVRRKRFERISDLASSASYHL